MKRSGMKHADGASSRKLKKAKTGNVGATIASQPPASQTMSQLYLCLSPVEQDRLAAFRRCTFASDAVSSFVASCLVKNSAKGRGERKRGLDLGARGLGVGMTAVTGNGDDDKLLTMTMTTSHTPQEPIRPLSEYVAPGTSSHISMIVSALAKIYAQRLIRSAREVANNSGYGCQEKLLPEHVLEAHSKRTKNGSDPGFFMQPQGMGRVGSEPFISTTYSSNLLKEQMEQARVAQELYDKASANKSS